MATFDEFYQGNLNTPKINHAHIALIPKIDEACQSREF